MSKHEVISLSKVIKDYGGVHAVDEVSFSLNSGEFIALIGPNGAGKSTVFKLVLGLIGLSGGELRLLGNSPHDRQFNSSLRRVGFLPEQVLFHGALTGRETLHFYIKLKSGDVGETDSLLARVGLVEAGDRRVATYSKGMRQRLALAQCLIGNPELLMLDEPTSGLDPASRRNFFKIINQVKDDGTAILMSSHALGELEPLLDRAVILNKGRIVGNGSINELKSKLCLNTKIHIEAAPDEMQQLARKFADQFGAENFVNGVAVLECSENQKLELIKTLVSSSIMVDGLKIEEPGLETIFAALTSVEDLT